MKSSYIIIGAVIGAVILSAIFVSVWHNANSRAVTNIGPPIVQLDTMGEFLPDNSYVMVAAWVPSGIVIYSTSNSTFNNCTLMYQNQPNDNNLGSVRPLIVLENFITLNPINSYEKDILLNETSILGFECKDPSVKIWWPYIFLDKSTYHLGDIAVLRGSFGNVSSQSSVLTAFVSNAGPPYYFWLYPSIPPFPPMSLIDEKSITLNSKGEFEYSFKIPDNIPSDNRLTVGIKNKDELYTTILKIQ